MKPTRRRPMVPTARDIMSKDVVTVKPTLGLRAAAAVLRDNHITGAAVTSETGRLIGVLSETDLVDREAQPRVRRFEVKRRPARARAGLGPAKTVEVLEAIEQPIDDSTVGEIFSPYVITAGPDATVADLAAQMVRHRVHRIFVVDGPALVGVVSSMDVMKAVSTVSVSRPRARRVAAPADERIEVI